MSGLEKTNVVTVELITWNEFLLWLVLSVGYCILVWIFVSNRRKKLKSEEDSLKNDIGRLSTKKISFANNPVDDFLKAKKIEEIDGDIANLGIEIKKRTEWFRYERAFIISGSVGIIFSLLVIILKTSQILDEGWIELKKDALVHFDITGIIIGVVGIIVGFLIFVVVENNSEIKTIKTNKNFKQLEEVNSEIKKINNDIRENLLNLTENRSLNERLEKINSIINHASTNDNYLYILSYDPVYGQFQMSNLKILMREKKVKAANELKKLSSEEFYKNFVKDLMLLKKRNKKALANFVKNHEGKLKMAVLKNSWIDVSEPSLFKNFVEDKIVRLNSDIAFVDLNNPDDLIEDFATKKITDAENTYVLVKREGDTNEHLTNTTSKEEKRELLIKNHIEEDIKFLSRLQKAENFELKSLDYIPFQFFLSFPEDVNSSNCEFSCLVIFTNYYNLAQDHGVMSFSSVNQRLAIGLRSMFNGLVKDEDAKNQHLKYLNDLFKIQLMPEIKIVLKTITAEQAPEYTPTIDILAKDALSQLLVNHNVRISPTAVFINKIEKLSALKQNSFLSIGLFKNPLSEAMAQYQKGNEGRGRLLQLEKKPNADTNTEKIIKIAESGNIHDAVSDIRFKEFRLSFNPKQSIDYVIFCKLLDREKDNKKWVFIFGGMSALGTSKIAECLDEKNCAIIKAKCAEIAEKNEKALPEQEFIAVFKVSKTTNNHPLVFLSIVDESGKINNIPEKQLN